MTKRKGLKERVMQLHFASPTATTSEIAQTLGVGVPYVRATFQRNGLKTVDGRKHKRKQVVSIVKARVGEAAASGLLVAAE